MPQGLSRGEWTARVALLAVAAIAIAGGALQMALGQPDTTPRLDHIHRFLAGIYLSTGLICLWTAVTIRRQRDLVGLIALGVLLSAAGRLASIATVGLPDPAALWLAYVAVELLLGAVLALAWRLLPPGRR